ncbi:hypothetical protein [Paenibacillus piri]|uniref:Beta-galactosidase trimerisation domain-containing protein n=1 Tax=Paenibacillus piri TaxID=2547395 RepID=A0A4R5KL19_9BACL|nr:hypothetical protein [Paenibacillus piri]TDF96259.1 hypothetical protein E1757_17880 [Paenibacillus piri]
MDTTARDWWQKPLRIIQPNLQIKDTALIDPQKLASQMKEMGANAIVFNVAGIYAWYPTRVPFHTVNEYLPQSFDLLKAVIEACHKEGLRFIGRFDFSRAEDSIYLQKPQWFAKKTDGEPEIVGLYRPGPWSMLMNTCINGAYRNEAVALPVLDEVISNYDLDGIFFNAPGYSDCWCEACRQKYAAKYGQPLPANKKEFAEDWASTCMRDNMDKFYSLIKNKNKDIPMILYYNLYHDNLFDRAETTDMLCTEPQDILSLGHHHIPEFWKPALSIKLGRSLPDRPTPFGIVHSSPGMDWRHTGLPPAEYRFWLSQIPAHGGSIWHSLTGIPDTIGDKRILEIVAAFNADVKQVESDMDGAAPLSQVALMWTADPSAEGMADGLINKQVPFDVLLTEQAVPERLAQYKALIIPEGMKYTESFVDIISAYVEQGGCVIVEGAVPKNEKLLALLGIGNDIYVSQSLTASYLRFEGQGNPLQKGLEQTELIAHRGKVAYVTPAGERTQVLATLVPPFSPLDAVGRPPERASLPVSHTELPLALTNKIGRGIALYMPFSLSHLINEYKLVEHYQLLANAVDYALGDEPLIEVTHMPGLQITLFEKEGHVLIHLVNGAGRRPLTANIPLTQIEVKLRLPGGGRVKAVQQLISGEALSYRTDEAGAVSFTVPSLLVWECLRVETE